MTLRAFLKQNFIDSLGRFNREMYEEAIFNPQNEQVLLQAENSLSKQDIEKTSELITSRHTVSEDEIKENLLSRITFMNASICSFANALFPDSVIKYH